MTIPEQTILLVSDNVSVQAAARRDLEAREGRTRVEIVSTMDAAYRMLGSSSAPGVILLDEAAVKTEPEGPLGKAPRLDTVVSSLATHAPVVVIGPAEREGELSVLVAAGVVDYVVRSANSLETALERVEQRLRGARHWSTSARRRVERTADGSDGSNREDFGETLRHELNNPLTGILGNAELLLAEMRRKDDGHIPKGGQQRLETIAALAVRMRETVRRLSDNWESRHDPVQSLQGRTPT